MPDQFQYVKLPDGSYGKFDAGVGDDAIRSAIVRDFPDAFRKVQSPIAPPKLRPPNVDMHRSYLMGPAEDDPDRAGEQLTEELMGMVNSTAMGLARASGPNIIYQQGRKMLHKPEDTRYGMGMPGTQEVIQTALPFFLGPEAMGESTMARGAVRGAVRGAEAAEGAGVAAPVARGRVPPLTRSSGKVPAAAVRGAATGAPSAPNVPNIARDLLDVVKPSVGHRMDAGSRLLKRLGLGSRESSSIPLSDIAAPGERGGFPQPTEAEQIASFQNREYNAALGSTRSPNLKVQSNRMEANPPHEPAPVHTPSGGARQILQKQMKVKMGDIPADEWQAGHEIESQVEGTPRPRQGNRADVLDDQGIKQEIESRLRQHHVQPQGSIVTPTTATGRGRGGLRKANKWFTKLKSQPAPAPPQ